MANKVCQRDGCKSDRLMDFNGKCADLFSSKMLNTGIRYEGYVPDDIPPFKDGFGDYVQGVLCLDCGQLQGKWPIKKSVVEKPKEDRE